MGDRTANAPVPDEQQHSGMPVGSTVDVARAEQEFAELSRQLSRRSGVNDNTSASTINGSQHESKDIEKGDIPNEHDTFDLREYLVSSNDANQQAGIKHKNVGVTWDDLSVEVDGATDDHKYYVETFGLALTSVWMTPFFIVWNIVSKFLPKRAQATHPILHSSSGVLKPGEMCLVLGCPGAGCTTFLKTMANQREEYAAVNGHVLYAGLDANTMKKAYKGEVVYNEEDDRHIPTLTVGQTLQFALSTKTPGATGRLPDVTGKEFKEEVQSLLLRMLNISHTKNTLVGDEFVRGVSGGERKRVSIAEMMATRARVQCWDNSTRGLDASTALDFVKSLRIMTDVLGQTTFVTLYQAGEGIYDLFDKVMVLNKGRQVFFGPPTEARAYFENLGYKPLPRQSTPDYLTGCTDPNERQFAPGRSSKDVPSNPEALEYAFRQSSFGRELEQSRESYKLYQETDRADQEAFREAVAKDKKKGVSKKSPYTLGFFGQVKAITVRQFQQKKQDTFFLTTSFTLSTILAIVIGGAYFNQPATAAGAFTRSSVMFVALLTVCLDAFGEMPVMMVGRPILRKQTSYRLYRPAAIALANTLADVPFSSLRILIFNIIVYFMTRLDRSAGGFFVFHLFINVAYLTIQGLFRTLGLLCVNPDSAFRVATLFIPAFVSYAGYMLPVFAMKRWLFWIYYIDPLAYAFQGLMENEFMRNSMTCEGSYVIPRNIGDMTQYPEDIGPNQACTVYGSTPGTRVIEGTSYIINGFGMNPADLWRRCFIVLVGFFFFFQVTQMIVLEYFPQNGGDKSVNVFVKENAESKKLNGRLQQRRAQKLADREASGETKEVEIEGKKDVSPTEKPYRRSFTWENLNYHVPTSDGQLRLLHDVNGFVKPGTLTALMGSSGAGKTTCLDVLAQRKNIGVISGDVLVDGRPLSSDFARGTAYAEQMDVHEGTATVREAMRFSAFLRQPASVSQQEKEDYVEEMIELLELQDLANALVQSLGVEARKRLTIGVELASKPELLLFLDEPTSGLDGQSAWNLVRFLRKLADQGQAILCTIHQPSAMLFESFDRLLLLERGGETVYFGDIGDDSQIVREYFARHGAPCPSNVNPAEFMLEAIGAGVTPRIGDRDWKDVWADSPEFLTVKKEIDAIKASGLARPATENENSSMFATSILYQLRLVASRNNLALWRSPDYIFTRLCISIIVSLFTSLTLLQLGNSVRDLQYRVFGIFWVVILPAVAMSQVEPLFVLNRRVFIRESSSRIYSPYVFALGQLIGEIPYDIMCAVVYWVLMAYPMGFGQGGAGAGGTAFQLLVTIFLMLFGVALGQLVAAVSPSIQVAALWNPFLALILGTFCGVTLPYPTMISFWKSWMYELTPYTRTIAAMVSTELYKLWIECEESEFYVFPPPEGQTCEEWAGPFVSAAGGYLQDKNATDSCQYCQYRWGDEFFLPLNMKYENRWRDAWILFAFFVFNAIATVIASRFFRFAKR